MFHRYPFIDQPTKIVEPIKQIFYLLTTVHHVPEASESEATVFPTTHAPSDREGSDLPPIFGAFSHGTPTEEHVEHTPEGSEGTLKELVVPHDHQIEEPHQQEEAQPDEVHGIVVTEPTQEAPQGKGHFSEKFVDIERFNLLYINIAAT